MRPSWEPSESKWLFCCAPAWRSQHANADGSVMMPMINRIQGTLVLQSNKNIQSTCSRFSDGDVVGAKPVRCRSASRDTQGSGTQSGSGSSSTNTNAAGHYSSSPETVFSIFGGLAALFGLFM